MQKKWLLILALGGTGFVGFAIFWLYRIYNNITVIPSKPIPIISIISPTPTPTPDPLAPFSILLMGYGGGKHEGGRLTDSIIVAKIEPKNSVIKLISIPRDIWVPIPINDGDTKNFKVNAAYAIGSDDRGYPNKKIEFTGKGGGGELSKYVLSQIVGFKIDYFVAMDFKGFIKFIDIIGGIDVQILKSFVDPMYPLETDIIDNCGKSDEEIVALSATMSGEKLEKEFACRYESLSFEKGVQHMDGVTALKFARSRHSKEDGGDFNRGARQKQVILAARDKIVKFGFVTKIIPILNMLSGNLLTDINIDKINEIIKLAPKLVESKVSSVALSDQNVLTNAKSIDGQFVLIPTAGENNWNEVYLYVENMGETATTIIPVVE